MPVEPERIGSTTNCARWRQHHHENPVIYILARKLSAAGTLTPHTHATHTSFNHGCCREPACQAKPRNAFITNRGRAACHTTEANEYMLRIKSVLCSTPMNISSNVCVGVSMQDCRSGGSIVQPSNSLQSDAVSMQLRRIQNEATELIVRSRVSFYICATTEPTIIYTFGTGIQIALGIRRKATITNHALAYLIRSCNPYGTLSCAQEANTLEGLQW